MDGRDLSLRDETLKQAFCEVYTTALWQRRVVHFMRNAMSYVKRGADSTCLDELKLIWTSRRHRHVRL